VSSTARLSSVTAPSFTAARQALDADRSVVGREYCEALSGAADGWLDQLFAAATEGRRISAALLAVGGYGRGELCPGSDIDVVLVHKGGRDVAAVADALWYPVWDDGVHLDYSVRLPDEVTDMAKRDVKVALGFVTARTIAGDRELGDGVIDRVRRLWADRPDVSLGRLRAETEQRWDQYGELAFLLEPDLKRARGGMRDIDAVHAAAAATGIPVVDAPSLTEAAELLLSIRVALHQLTGRNSDQLLLEQQDSVAARLNFVDADELMKAVAEAGRRITWMTDDAWHRFDARPRRTGSRRELDDGLAVIDGEVALTETAALDDPSLAFRTAAAAAELGAPIARAALQHLATQAHPPVPWPAATRNALVALLGCGAPAVTVLETLDQVGVLERFLPEWVSVRSRPQRNSYHRYTVDRHLCEAAANAARRVRDVHRPDLLLIGAWLHDIGKGAVGDHTIEGERIVAGIATRMGFDQADVDELVRIVRYHLLLPDTATRRDLDDPATIASVAEAVGTPELLDLLAALAGADGEATGPAAWGGWKADLVSKLVSRTHAVLAGEPHDIEPDPPTPAEKQLMADGHLRVVPDGSRVTVVAPDRPGLLSLVAGTFSLHKLRIRSANARGEGDMACDVFDLEPGRDEPVAWDRVETDLGQAIAGELDLEAALARRVSSARPVRPGAARPAHPRVLVDNSSTPRATVVEVRAPDGVGVLYRIAGAIAASGFDIRSAKVLTLGHEVVDTFYVVEAGLRRKSSNPAALRRLEDAVLSALRRPW
jgi:[protein-PII] uridylyltransferase